MYHSEDNMNEKDHRTQSIEDESECSSFEEKITCPLCGSSDVYGISRIVGYFSEIDNWNKSKQAEFKRRQKGNYWTSKIEE